MVCLWYRFTTYNCQKKFKMSFFWQILRYKNTSKIMVVFWMIWPSNQWYFNILLRKLHSLETYCIRFFGVRRRSVAFEITKMHNYGTWYVCDTVLQSTIIKKIKNVFFLANIVWQKYIESYGCILDDLAIKSMIFQYFVGKVT